MDGYIFEELKMVYEIYKIFGDDSVRICFICVCVFVLNCYSEVIIVCIECLLDVVWVCEFFVNLLGICVVDELDLVIYLMLLFCDGCDDVYVGCIC